MTTVTGIYVYPIKSCRGIKLCSSGINHLGLRADRQYVLVDEKGNFISQRRVPKMCLIDVGFEVDYLQLSAPGIASFAHPLRLPTGKSCTVDIWGGIGYGFDQGDDVAQWFSSALGIPCRLLECDRSRPRMRNSSILNEDVALRFADGYPVLIISEASLEDLNRRLPAPVEMDRFRPNIVVGGGEPYEEDAWGDILIGDMFLRGVKLCVRCSIPLVDQTTGKMGKEPLAALSSYRKLPPAPGHPAKGVVFGKNFLSLSTGSLKLGAEVRVVG